MDAGLDEVALELVDDALRAIEEASARLSLYPADYLGCGNRGRIAVGASADLVVLDRSLQVKDVYIEGERLRDSASALS